MTDQSTLDVIIDANTNKILNIVGIVFFVTSATGALEYSLDGVAYLPLPVQTEIVSDFHSIWIKNAGGEAVALKARYGLERIINQPQSSVSFAGSQPVHFENTPSMTISNPGDIVLNGTFTNEVNSSLTSIPDVVVNSGLTVEASSFAVTKRGVTVLNPSSNVDPVRVGGAGTGAGAGIEVEPGASIELIGRYPVLVYSPSAQSVQVIEEHV